MKISSIDSDSEQQPVPVAIPMTTFLQTTRKRIQVLWDQGANLLLRTFSQSLPTTYITSDTLLLQRARLATIALSIQVVISSVFLLLTLLLHGADPAAIAQCGALLLAMSACYTQYCGRTSLAGLQAVIACLCTVLTSLVTSSYLQSADLFGLLSCLLESEVLVALLLSASGSLIAASLNSIIAGLVALHLANQLHMDFILVVATFIPLLLAFWIMALLLTAWIRSSDQAILQAQRVETLNQHIALMIFDHQALTEEGTRLRMSVHRLVYAIIQLSYDPTQRLPILPQDPLQAVSQEINAMLDAQQFRAERATRLNARRRNGRV